MFFYIPKYDILLKDKILWGEIMPKKSTTTKKRSTSSKPKKKTTKKPVKKTTRKTTKKQSVRLSTEGLGLIYIIIAIIALPSLGVVGAFLTNVGTWLLGIYGSIFYIAMFVLGSYMVYRGDYPHMLGKRYIGFYMLILGLMLLTHGEFIRVNGYTGNEIINSTVDELGLIISGGITNAGGGILGAVLCYVFIVSVGDLGLKIFSIFFIVIGICYIFNTNIFEIIKSVLMLLNKQRAKNIKTPKRKVKPKPKVKKQQLIEAVEEAEAEFEETKKIVISNFDELKDLKQAESPVEPEVIEPESKEPINDQASNLRDLVNSENRKGKDPSDYAFYKLPPLSLLKGVSDSQRSGSSNLFIEQNAKLLEETLSEFGVSASVVAINVGPTVTQYELEIRKGTKVSRIVGLSKEIALALAASDVRIQAPIPRKSTIGVEIPNEKQSVVGLKEIIRSRKNKDNPLRVGLGRDIQGKPIFVEINAMPHLLVAGATGSGKSVCINSIITSILMQAKPNEVKMILIDPKKVELNAYNGVPHLMTPVVTDPKKASVALKKVCTEMERRYELFSEAGTRNIAGYNKYLELNAEEEKKLPFMVVVVDELADLMMVAKSDVEESIIRITQLARAAGIHLIIATQRPSTDVITGLIKANIPSRIAFGVSRSIDSRVILDATGAEKLLGKGDMLFLGMGEPAPIRVQGTYISDDELTKVVNYCVKQQTANYDLSLTTLEDENKPENVYDDHTDAIYDDVVKFVIESSKASASLLQRRFRIGYNRAARLIDSLEANGVIGPSNGSKPREVLVQLEESSE